jgi:hypothetical protein
MRFSLGPDCSLLRPRSHSRLPTVLLRSNCSDCAPLAIAESGFDLFVPSEAAARLERALLEHGQELGALRVGLMRLEVARIEDGIPVDGIDITGDTILLETDA